MHTISHSHDISLVALSIAIAAMHYTGMATSQFSPASGPPNLTYALSISSLGISAVVGSALVLFLAIGASILHRRLAGNAAALSRFAAIVESSPTAPLIVVAEALDHQTAVACLRAGAEDVVLTGHVPRLWPVARRALSVRQPLKRLTRRQLEVFRLVSEGRTTRQMAERLGVSAKTVETHRGAMTKRLGIREVAHQVRYAIRVGLISAGDPAESALRVAADGEDKLRVIAA